MCHHHCVLIIAKVALVLGAIFAIHCGNHRDVFVPPPQRLKAPIVLPIGQLPR
jgi:hypothetical protein